MKSLLLFVVCIGMLLTFFVDIRIHGDSLLPHWRDGESILGIRILHESMLNRDHLSVFRLVGSESLYVKPLVGISGDRFSIECFPTFCVLTRHDGYKFLAHNPSSHFVGAVLAYGGYDDFTLPKGKCLVLGFSNQAYDSADFGLLYCNTLVAQSLFSMRR